MNGVRKPPAMQLVSLPPRAASAPDTDAIRLAARVRELRSTLSPDAVPPPVIPIRGELRPSEGAPLVFLRLRNLSGRTLQSMGVEVLTLAQDGSELGTMYAALSDLGVSRDPRAVKLVGGWPVPPDAPVAGVVITVLFARFDDGSSWDGELETLEDPRVVVAERARRCAEFFRTFDPFLRAVELRDVDLGTAN